MGLYQSFPQVFVTNSPALLAEGQTVDNLAVGQIGLLDAKTYKAVSSPTYAKNKALFAVWGTADVNLGDFGGVPNENEYSKIIKGKLVKGLRAKKAQRGQTPVYTVGWSGDVADTDTLFARAGESKDLFIKLSGTVIDRLYSKQGIVKQFITTPACVDDCGDSCADVDCKDLAEQIVAQINSDKDFKKFIKAKAIVSCDPAVTVVETNCYKFKLSVCDTGDDLALGLVQAQYPLDKVVRTGRVGAISQYGVVKNTATAPDDFVSAPIFVPDCPVCTEGTLIDEANVFEFKVKAGGAAPVLPGQIDAVVLTKGAQFDVYTVTVDVTESVTDVLDAAALLPNTETSFIGSKRNICQLDEVTVEWEADGTLKKQGKKYRLTIADSVCGTNRLVDLQNAYPELVVSVVNAAGSCVHTYETEVKSNCYEVGCAIEEVKFIAPALFEGAEWKEVPAAATTGTCKCGIQIETAFINRTTNECTFDSFPYENDIVHVQISNYNPDYNASPCEGEWAVKQIRQVKYPQGHGAYIQHLEKESKQYDQRFRYSDPVLREVQGYSLQADATKFYDEYVLEFDTKWKSSGGWSEDYTQSFHLRFFVPEGQGAQIEKALSSYASSAGIEEEGIAI
jgi:hypothetical protein